MEREGKTLTRTPIGASRVMCDARYACRRMTPEQITEFLNWFSELRPKQVDFWASGHTELTAISSRIYPRHSS